MCVRTHKIWTFIFWPAVGFELFTSALHTLSAYSIALLFGPDLNYMSYHTRGRMWSEVLKGAIYFTNILRAACAPIVFWQKKYKPKMRVPKICVRYFWIKKLQEKCRWNWLKVSSINWLASWFKDKKKMDQNEYCFSSPL